MINVNVDEQIKIISKGADEVIALDELKEKLKEGKPLTVKLGLDPSAPDIHIGHAVVLRKIKQLQDLGHKAVIIIGDFTGMIGDPSGKSKTRKPLTKEQVLENAKTYEKQIFKILDREKTDLRFNSEWLDKLNFRDVIELSSKYTVARMLERDDFENRMNNHLPIGIHEFFYPLMQGFDSVAIKADIELGGTDQKFNVLMGRTIQKEYNLRQQNALFMPILEGIDGVEKMSKSLGNYIGISEAANVMYEKVMKVPDNLIIKYFNLATDLHPDVVAEIEKSLKDGSVNPRDIKMRLAREIVALYHDEAEVQSAEEAFKNIFQKNLIPEDLKEISISENSSLISAMVSSGFVPSNSEAKRLVKQGGVKINGEKVSDINFELSSDDVVQIGKAKFFKAV
ncbi:MAG: tyrosine--tRNA ligase [Clostridium sp.]|uniref:tyrosine--tRNA ligase n=1 Tax=Clostridium sp. TaxID=1506 RepID=UPI002A863864|nr:tyrosine--tRNA ligase [Clostridium sp.]MDY5097796.1 tyrosine--tRNA ligase [Clostridium sp.]